MKRTLIYLAVLVVCGRASQQQGVTLFGTVDARDPRPVFWDVEAAFAGAA